MVEVPDFVRRAMEAHGVDPEEVAVRASELADEEWEPLPLDADQIELDLDEEDSGEA